MRCIHCKYNKFIKKYRTGTNYSYRLFAKPSFVEGIARILDIDSTLNIYIENNTPDEADFEALYSDWKSVGDDIAKSIIKYYEQSSEHREHTIKRRYTSITNS
jgi:hypothetical protein